MPELVTEATGPPPAPALHWPTLWAQLGSGKRLSLRRGLVFLIIASLLPITILSIVQGLVRVENRRAAAIRQLSESAGAMADSNQTILASTEMLLRTVAANPLVRAGGAACAGALDDIRRGSPAYANLTAYDRDGWLACSAIAPRDAYLVPDRTWWNIVRRSPRPLVSDAVWGPHTGRRVMMMMLPVRDARGEFIGGISAAIDLDWLAKRLRSRITDPATGVAVVSDSGQVVMASRPLPAFDLRTPAGAVGRVHDAAGTQWSYTLVPLVPRAPDQNGLHVVYAAPEPARFGFVWWQTIIDFTLPVLAILLASLAIWYATQQLVLRWLLELQRLALHFAGGDYRRRPVSFADAPREIRSVAASLYRMSAAVAERDRRLRDSLDQQRRLAREVHHRVKNNFQVVMSLLSLQASRLTDPGARHAIDQARRRISALALVHRLLYDSGEFASVSSRALLETLCEQLQPPPPLAGRVRLQCRFDDMPLDIDSAVPLTLWLVEVVNNAFHHGFPEDRAGTVHADFGIGGGEAMLVVSDDGIGLASEAPAADRPGGYGLRLVKALAAQLGGTASVEPRPGGGSVAMLRFPLRPLVPPLEPHEA